MWWKLKKRPNPVLLGTTTLKKIWKNLFIDAFPPAAATNGPPMHKSSDIIKININTASLHGRMLSVFYPACGWQADWIVWCVFAKEETEASMLRLAWVSEIKPECCQDSWQRWLWFLTRNQGGKEKKWNLFTTKDFLGTLVSLLGTFWSFPKAICWTVKYQFWI